MAAPCSLVNLSTCPLAKVKERLRHQSC